MERTRLLGVLDAECGRLGDVLASLADREAAAPTRCAPWDVAALAAHTVGALGRVQAALDQEAPPRAEVDAAGYYAPDTRFSPEVDADRIDSAVRAAARHRDAAEPGRRLRELWKDLEPRLRDEPPGRVVRTRHGDAMALEDFLLTRVLELVVHGVDLADALGRDPWTSPEGAEAVESLLFGGAGRPEGMEALQALRAATGRHLEGGPTAEDLRGSGVRFLALG
ncbi:maleylpyruvate isomerase N-terminal domain-containing protein [Nocardiopsis suaedae]|uniref:Maleylpyruvate isomerase N-terminal domain-containing protein n=1 Tax=Nocardiopsis suaedae TaxID=3018444 RepID=A0ABT4TPU5_9ACTN|nr:maleylpyruvate isomerase N-terminal domain-containing protein [Nocardiopsis suaedae]MDA2806714.1 maleylpyruvate isomerase N-terminal domain-containing protein [Nocardiopsis suaedae]